MAKRRPRASKTSPLKSILRPLAGDSHRRASVDIHLYLRDRILTNALPPETILSQVEVADCLEVSRTPVREALRMLKEEGLVEAEPNYRCRVLGFDPRELEALYVSRIANEGIAAVITVPNMTQEDVQKLGALLAQLRKDEKQQNIRDWLKNHRAFHQLLFSRANPLLQQRMYADTQRSERYVYHAVQAGLTDIFRRADLEHEEIYEACKRRQATKVIALLSDHLAGAAIDIMAEYAPEWDPTNLRNAVRLMRAGATHFEQSGNKERARANSLHVKHRGDHVARKT
ncbi:MAG: GntR family transcriptional regulator [Betaproteobacteria bacterium]|nr:GntR family transcriptional regulator [Betaproteobacteria bacterium]